MRQSLRQRLGAWLALGRVSNLPTCWSHAVVGVTLAGAGAPAVADMALASLVISLFYLAGMVLNDAHDAGQDRRTKPDRPIPLGTIGHRAAWSMGWVLLLLGVGVVVWRSSPAGWAIGAALGGAIVLYTFLHLRWSASVLLLGLCRVLAIWLAMAMGGWGDPLTAPDPAQWLPPLLTGVYVVGLSVVARREDDQTVRISRAAVGLVVLVPYAGLIAVQGESIFLVLVMSLLLLAWSVRSAWWVCRREPNIRRGVMGWLAGLCLLDAFWLALLDHSAGCAAALGCFVLTWLGHRRIAGT
ncbi:MAG: UbiA family prenyltransferase [Phycisphaeraceae bacterium]|nr:UbiA family prenyltransferase [Phycisphaeraceae bacterium]